MYESHMQIYKGDPRTCAIFIPAWGSNWPYWGSSGFSRNQNTLTVVRQHGQVRISHEAAFTVV